MIEVVQIHHNLSTIKSHFRFLFFQGFYIHMFYNITNSVLYGVCYCAKLNESYYKILLWFVLCFCISKINQAINCQLEAHASTSLWILDQSSVFSCQRDADGSRSCEWSDLGDTGSRSPWLGPWLGGVD